MLERASPTKTPERIHTSDKIKIKTSLDIDTELVVVLIPEWNTEFKNEGLLSYDFGVLYTMAKDIHCKRKTTTPTYELWKQTLCKYGHVGW